MKRSLIFLFLAPLICLLTCCNSCTSITKEAKFDVGPIVLGQQDVSILLDYNVIVSTQGRGDRCGGTIIEKTRRRALVITAMHCVVDTIVRTDPILQLTTSRQILSPRVTIELNDETKIRVRILKVSPQKDLALLEVTDHLSSLKSAKLASHIPRVGDTAWLVGFGAGVKDVLSKGIVSKVSMMDVDSELGPFMLLDITAWYGNSGGGAFNDKFEFLGVLVRFGPQGGANQGWFFVVPLSEVVSFLGA